MSLRVGVSLPVGESTDDPAASMRKIERIS